MPQIFTSIYKFKQDNTKLIELISRYNKNVQIIQVNGVPIAEEDHAYCRNLPKLTSEGAIRDYTIVCRSENAESTTGIFPHPDDVFDDVVFARLIQTMAKEEIEHAKEIAKALVAYFTYGARSAEKPPKIEKLNSSQALLILQKLVEELAITGVMHFSSLQRVMFQFSNVNFVIKYGDNPYFAVMKPRAFDLEAGFIETDTPSEITIELQKQFIAWKESGYEGEFIPAHKSGFKIIAPKPIKDINSIADIQQNLITDYCSKYKLDSMDDLVRSTENDYAQLNMDVSKHDLLEHSLLYAAGQLPLANELRACSNFGFSGSSSNILLQYKTLSLYMGMLDNDFYIKDEISGLRKENEELPAYQQLKKLVDSTHINLNTYVNYFANYDSEHHYYRKINLQYNLVLNRKLAIKTYLKNPLFVAQYLLAHENEINDKAFIVSACKSLQPEVSLFKGMRKGVPDEVIDEMLAKLRSLANKYEATNVSTLSIFAAPLKLEVVTVEEVVDLKFNQR